MILLKPPEQIEIMHEANKLVHHILDYAEKSIEESKKAIESTIRDSERTIGYLIECPIIEIDINSKVQDYLVRLMFF